jgi:hypothetical protein
VIPPGVCFLPAATPDSIIPASLTAYAHNRGLDRFLRKLKQSNAATTAAAPAFSPRWQRLRVSQASPAGASGVVRAGCQGLTRGNRPDDLRAKAIEQHKVC